MDPLSITTSILTLIGAASKTYGFLQFILHADEEATSLCVEVSGLESVLFSVQAALKKCEGNPLNLASIDPDLWRRIDMTLSDCRETLDDLSQLAQRIRIKHSKFLPAPLYRARVAKRLQQHGNDIASYRDRIKMSNWSLQTLLQVIDVSLSLAGRDSQAQILSQLDLLNQRVHDRVKVSLCLNRSNSTSERRFLHNTEDFLLAIRAFHKSASTTAGTVQGNSGHGQDTTGGTEDYGSSSVVFRMPTRKRHEIVTLLQRNEKQEQLNMTSTALQVDDAEEIPSPLTGPQLAPLGLNLTTVFTDGFSKLAHRAIQDLDFLGAEAFLRRAMEHHRHTGIDSTQHRRLRKQLSLSLFFQGRDKEAKELVLDLAEHHGEGFNTTSQLLFVLALSLAHELEFDEARTLCEQLCQIRCMSNDGDSGMVPKNDIFKLLVTCYRQSRDWMSADAIIADIPDVDEEQCVPSPLEFILASDDLLNEFLGDAECRTTPAIFVSQVQSLPVAKRVTRLQERLDGASIFTTRFAASEIGDGHGGDGLLRLKSRNLGGAPQAVQLTPRKKPASLRATFARLSAPLKHIAFKRRLHSSFELLRWQKCTPEVEKMTPVRDILSWIEGQAAGHGITPVTDRFSDDADYSLDISGIPTLLIPELDSVELTNAATLSQPELKVGASYTQVLPSSPIKCTDVENPVLYDETKANSRTVLSWDPLSSAWIYLSDPTLPVFNWDGPSGDRTSTNPQSMSAPYLFPCRPITEETEIHELCAVTAADKTDPWDACDRPDPYLETELEVCYYLRHALEVIPEFSKFDPINDFSSSSSSIYEGICHELPGSGYPFWFGPESLDVYSDCLSTTEQDPTNLLEVPRCRICQWTPDRSYRRPIRKLQAAVVKHIKHNRPKRTYGCPVCWQVFHRADKIKPHVTRKHPEMLKSLYPVDMHSEQNYEQQRFPFG